MTRYVSKTTLAAALALTASVGLALPAFAETTHHSHRHHMASRTTHHAVSHQAYRSGYDQGFRDGHYAAVQGHDPDDDGVVTGRSAYVDPYEPGYYEPGVLGNGGILGTGVLGGDGVLGTGVLDGRGALGVGVLGF